MSGFDAATEHSPAWTSGTWTSLGAHSHAGMPASLSGFRSSRLPFFVLCPRVQPTTWKHQPGFVDWIFLGHT